MNIRKTLLAIATMVAVVAPSSVAHAAGGGGGGGGGGGTTATGADLQVTGSASTGSPAPTQNFIYTWQVKNNGPQVSYSDVLTTTLPAGETLYWAQLQNYAFVINCTSAVDASGLTNLTCPLPNMQPGEQENILVDVYAPPVAGALSDTATVSSASTPDPKPANNSFTVNQQVKSATCALPAGQPTLFGLVTSGGGNGPFTLLVNGVTYTVNTNYFDGTQPLTSVVNMLCQPVPTTEVLIGTNLYVTGTVDTVNHTIAASVIQTLFFKDLGA